LPVAVDNQTVVRLLVIDDAADFRWLVRNAFQEHCGKIRWDLTFAEDGAKALRFLFSKEKESAPLPSLVLLDWNLPGTTGEEVLRRMKADAKLRRIPVLVFSTSDAEEDIHAAYDGHANGYISKPTTFKLLCDIVEAIEQFWIAIAQLPKVARQISA
jgi:CheY-like chemotaxis protein